MMDIKNAFLVFDGAMGTMLQDVLPVGKAPETLNVTNPDAVLRVHQAYVQAGADVVTSVRRARCSNRSVRARSKKRSTRSANRSRSASKRAPISY